MAIGLVIMYSASGQSYEMMDKQAMRMLMALGVMFFLAQIKPRTMESLAPILYVVGVCLLLGVLFLVKALKVLNAG